MIYYIAGAASVETRIGEPEPEIFETHIAGAG